MLANILIATSSLEVLVLSPPMDVVNSELATRVVFFGVMVELS